MLTERGDPEQKGVDTCDVEMFVLLVDIDVDKEVRSGKWKKLWKAWPAESSIICLSSWPAIYLTN